MGIRAERMTRMATIEIKMLGGFEIRVNGKPVLAQLAQSRKATALVQYLVLRRGERVSHKVLTDTLWAGERSTNPDMALRAILHRFRLMIDAEGLDEMKGCIVTSRGYYQWNPHLDCSVDVFEVNDLSELARKESDAEKRSRIYEQIVNLYDGRLLPQSASEPWVESVSVRLHGQYRTAILNLLELCKKWGESTRIVTLCTRALELDPYEERLYLEKIVALETLGRHEEAEDLARRGSAMGCLHHAIEPGRAGSAYRQMRQADRNMESEVSKLISALPDTEDTGACICDFETFKEIYRVQRGVQVRYGLQVFLAILTVAPSQNTDAAETALMVEQLGDLITLVESQDEVFKQADFISLHTPLTPETEHSIGMKQFKMMETILYLYKKSKALIAMGMPMSVLKEDKIFDKIISIKYDVPNDRLDMFDDYKKQIDAFYEHVLERNA